MAGLGRGVVDCVRGGWVREGGFGGADEVGGGEGFY